MVAKGSKKIQEETFSSSADIPVPEKLIDQVIGQDHAVEIIKKAAKQRRHVLLIGPSGTGKSMLAQGMSELLPAEDLEDVLAYPNPLDESNPKIKVVKTYPKGADRTKEIGQGRKILYESKFQKRENGGKALAALFVVLIIALLAINFNAFGEIKIDIEKHANLIGAAILGILIFASTWLFTARIRLPAREENTEPKLLLDNTGVCRAPFIEATGAKAGALFGEALHDPLQSGGLGTPAHLRLVAGAIHKANKGVLYIDEIGSLTPKSQQDLLTAMQEKKFPITGQSEMSSGAMVRSEPVPCDFVLVAAGNVHDLQHIHPALRSRIRGYGYEVYLNDTMPDTPENVRALMRFVAQEVKKDGKIPHFARDAIDEIIAEARRRSGRKRRLTLKLRDLGGLVRAAGDIAKQQGAQLVTAQHVRAAKSAAQTIEQQIAAQFIDVKKEYAVLATTGQQIGRVNGLALIGDSGLIIPIVAEVTPASSRFEGKVIATGKLGEIAKEAVENVSAVIKKHMQKDVASYDIHIQFLQVYEGVEGDSASISVAVAVLSAMEGIAVRQDIAMTGSLSVRGEVLPVGGVTQKVEAALEAGINTIIVPERNVEDIVLPKEKWCEAHIIPAKTIIDVLAAALIECERKKQLIAELRKRFK